MSLLRVSASSDPTSTAGALANAIRAEGQAQLQTIGPKAVNQAIKAIAIARGYLAPSGIDLISVPSFVDVFIEGKQKTAIRLLVKPRHPLSESMTVPQGRCHCPPEELRQDESSEEASLLVA
ncbi:stage V sporulation protein S [Candidatus Acetothermia bacterium]|nr:stage V sporulation protein S [Candidatus Acetothermia bacterium]MBI3460628.1 stage V sporulation protein S [Candidatus Acetothermia bacterium]MBI3660796.1 stage V sporulation protein S [Candidatus Acetothermia bacterium]